MYNYCLSCATGICEALSKNVILPLILWLFLLFWLHWKAFPPSWNLCSPADGNVVLVWDHGIIWQHSGCYVWGLFPNWWHLPSTSKCLFSVANLLIPVDLMPDVKDFVKGCWQKLAAQGDKLEPAFQTDGFSIRSYKVEHHIPGQKGHLCRWMKWRLVCLPKTNTNWKFVSVRVTWKTSGLQGRTPLPPVKFS